MITSLSPWTQLICFHYFKKGVGQFEKWRWDLVCVFLDDIQPFQLIP